MTDLDDVKITGNLVADMQLKKAGETAFGVFTLASNRERRSEDGTYKKYPTFFRNLAIFGKRAEALKPYLVKGAKILVTGHLVNNDYEKDGVKVSTLIVRVDDILLLKIPNRENVPDEAEKASAENDAQPDEIPEEVMEIY